MATVLCILQTLLPFFIVFAHSIKKIQDNPSPPFVIPNGSAVFWEGLHGSACYRIPSIIESHKGTLLAFAVNRIDSCHDQSNHSLVLRRSIDQGKTWGPVITIKQGTPPCPGCTAAISSPSPVEVSKPGGFAILVIFETLNNPTNASHGYDMQIWSLDDGLTWGNASKLWYPPLPNLGAMSGPATGIQASNGDREIYFPLRTLTGSEFLLISSDFGQTWKASTLSTALSECSIAFVPGSSEKKILANCRPDKDHHRRQQLWTRTGEPIGNYTVDTSGVDPSCAGSIVASGASMYTSHANTTSLRCRMAVQRSLDGGSTWDGGVLVWPGPSGYSQLVPLRSGDVGLLFEAGDTRTHAWHFAQTIQYVLVPPADRAPLHPHHPAIPASSGGHGDSSDDSLKTKAASPMCPGY